MALTTQTLRDYKKRLLQQKKMLERSALSAVEQGRATLIDDAADATDQAVLSYEKEFLFSRGTQTHGQLAQVKSALERMEDGTYGECIECGEMIGAKRLEAVPWTSHCIACQEKIERGELEETYQAA